MKPLTKFLLFIIGAVVLELLAMSSDVMHLPSGVSQTAGVAAALLLIVAVWEKPKPDEREQQIAWRSSHYAFIAVSTVLAGTLAYQTINHAVDVWLLVAVGALVIAKLAGRLWAQRNT
jgi:hypothetical protein